MPYLISRSRAELLVAANGTLFTVTPVWAGRLGSVYDVELHTDTGIANAVTASIYVFENPNAAFQFLRDTVTEDPDFAWQPAFGTRDGLAVSTPSQALVMGGSGLTPNTYPFPIYVYGPGGYRNNPYSITGDIRPNPQGNLTVITVWSAQPEDAAGGNITELVVKTIHCGGEVT